MPRAPRAKGKRAKNKYADVTIARLSKQVDELTKWVRILKGMTGLGGWSYEAAVKAHKPDLGGGPPPFP
jgi:hypothetical protein